MNGVKREAMGRPPARACLLVQACGRREPPPLLASWSWAEKAASPVGLRTPLLPTTQSRSHHLIQLLQPRSRNLW